MGKAAVFLDRDGTINEQMGYINHLSRFVLLPSVGRAIGLLNRAGYLVIVVSNQSGVARGYFPLALVHTVHERMGELLAEEGARIDAVFFCPHHPDGKIEAFRRPCDCRKPRTGLIEQARRQFDIDMSGSCVVGDRMEDVEMAYRASLPGILVTTGYGMGESEYILPEHAHKPVFVAEGLLDAVRWILERKTAGGAAASQRL